MPLEIMRPMTAFFSVLMPWARAMFPVRAGGAYTAADLGAEEPVEQANHHGCYHQEQQDGVSQRQLSDVAGGDEKVELIHAYGKCGLRPRRGAPAHNAQIY